MSGDPHEVTQMRDKPLREQKALLCDFSENCYVSMVWHWCSSAGLDWMGMLFRFEDEPEDEWTFRWRYRFDAATGNDDDDEKMGFGDNIRGSEEACRKFIDENIVAIDRNRARGELSEVKRRPIELTGSSSFERYVQEFRDITTVKITTPGGSKKIFSMGRGEN